MAFLNKLLRSNGASRRRYLLGDGNGKSNGDGFFEQGMPIPTFVVTGTVKRLIDLAIFGWKGPKPKILDTPPNELRIECPASGLNDPKNIQARIDSKNRFILSAKNEERDIDYKMRLDLPGDANFEKATFDARLEYGMVYVTVTNFQKKDVNIEVK